MKKANVELKPDKRLGKYHAITDKRQGKFNQILDKRLGNFSIVYGKRLAKLGPLKFRDKEGIINISNIYSLPVLDFLWLIWQFLQHILPKALQPVRDDGFLRGNSKRLRLKIKRELCYST